MPTLHRVTFSDPSGVNEDFVWPTNPAWDAESKAGTGYQQKQLQIERTSNTGNVGATKQQGDDGPLIFHWEFAVYDGDFAGALFNWYMISKKQSIYFTDFNGDKYEGQIITMQMARQGAAGGPGATGLVGFYYNMVFEFEVWRLISGLLATYGVDA